MKKLSSRITSLCCQLRRKGLSHREISKRLKIGLGSAFKYSKGINLTKKQHLALKGRNLSLITLEKRRLGGLHFPSKFKAKYNRKNLISFIKRFVEKNKRIPTKKEVSSHKPYVRLFGSWNNAIKEAGFNPNPVKFARKHRAFDGHKCDSFAEFIIDNWLYQKGIPHKIHVPYSNSSMSSDFWINNTHKVIEIYPEDLFLRNKIDKIFQPLLKP